MTPKVTGTAVLYTRVSTTEQADSGLGLAAQREWLADEAKRRDRPQVKWVTDEGVSGGVDAADRPALGPALDGMGPGDVLVVTKLDRLSRSLHDFTGLLRRSEREGWGVVCLDPQIDTTTPNGLLVVHVLMAVSQWECETIGQRIREGLAQSEKRLGRKPGLPPVGAAARPPAPVPSRVEAMVRDARSEGLSQRAIADRLNGYEIPSLRGGRWHRESVRRLLVRLEGA
jgi:DNA invertase Pin-like site-specific DNA recombinase